MSAQQSGGRSVGTPQVVGAAPPPHPHTKPVLSTNGLGEQMNLMTTFDNVPFTPSNGVCTPTPTGVAAVPLQPWQVDVVAAAALPPPPPPPPYFVPPASPIHFGQQQLPFAALAPIYFVPPPPPPPPRLKSYKPHKLDGRQSEIPPSIISAADDGHTAASPTAVVTPAPQNR
eukprot:CAMPEP_0177776058 /NCGR_PEP_ID=MMETSP0491_2-20121128/14482_1 /TAXON_ID=63592 /ORGANISM="Tetraselmis chuii, Strain PLY429" /LENGTH=171 /DNA_ID=CAMNT_0019294767 /DNA_START=186 /DNA_END=697 /DNA_ORIENTATION=-